MKTWIKKHFALTDKGAGDIVKAIISSFLLCVANFLPAMLLLLFLDELVLQNLKMCIRDRVIYDASFYFSCLNSYSYYSL